MLGSGEAVVLANFRTTSQKGKKMHSKRRKNSMVKGICKTVVITDLLSS